MLEDDVKLVLGRPAHAKLRWEHSASVKTSWCWREAPFSAPTPRERHVTALSFYFIFFSLFFPLFFFPGEVFDYLVAHGRMKEKEARAKFRQVSSSVSSIMTLSRFDLPALLTVLPRRRAAT